MSDDDKEHCETMGPRLAARPIVQQKVEPEQPMTKSPSSILTMSYISDRLISFLLSSVSSLIISFLSKISSFLLPKCIVSCTSSVSISNSPRLG
ncbi:hypothetical protein E5288_WYG015482 [Bos mutus]|uniref:Uncharacterized protein n=1 Tax=Bos mutus TaxID=72004 RepID=A0A6B0S4U6_9CETA|nr:hypothetical protein [Bos mutus]